MMRPDAELGLLDFYKVFSKRKWILAATLGLSLTSINLYLRRQPPTYTAEASIRYDPPAGKFYELEASWERRDVIKNEARGLTTLEMAERVARKLGWKIDRVYGRYKATMEKDSNLISISASGLVPEEITKLVNAVAQEYLERDREERSLQGKKVLQDLMRRSAEVESGLFALEERRRKFLETNHTAGQGAALAASLLEQEARRKDLLKKFTPEHPEVAKATQRIQATEARLAQIPGQELELARHSRAVKVSEDLFIELNRQMEQVKTQLGAVGSHVSIVSWAAVPRSPSGPDKRRYQMIATLAGLLAGVVLILMLENMDLSLRAVEDIETMLDLPVLGVIPHFLSTARWSPLSSLRLGNSRHPVEVFRKHLIVQHKRDSPAAEAYHSLRAGVQAKLGRPAGWVLMITSTGAAEGKTLTAVNFCLAAAQAGMRTLLIEADTRRPTLNDIFGVPRGPGLCEVLSRQTHWERTLIGTVDFLMGDMDLERLVSYKGIDNFKAMTGVGRGLDVVSLLSSDSLEELIADSRKHFDLVLFDCPPALMFVDPMLIAPHVDGTLLVYKAGRLAGRAVLRCKEQLAATKTHLLGVVLNDMEAFDLDPAYGYYHDYARYYQDGKKA